MTSYYRAVLHEPAYASRPYFHEERAGALFGTARFYEASQAYELANKLAADPRLVGLRADALMFAGRYAEALAAFREFNASGEDKAEWRIKERFMGIVVEQIGIDSQERDSAAAQNAVDLDYQQMTPAELAVALEGALRLDALFPVAHFNLGRAHLDTGNETAALADYLVAAATQRLDAGGLDERDDPCDESAAVRAGRRCRRVWRHNRRGELPTRARPLEPGDRSRTFGEEMLRIVDQVFRGGIAGELRWDARSLSR